MLSCYQRTPTHPNVQTPDQHPKTGWTCLRSLQDFMHVGPASCQGSRENGFVVVLPTCPSLNILAKDLSRANHHVRYRRDELTLKPRGRVKNTQSSDCSPRRVRSSSKRTITCMRLIMQLRAPNPMDAAVSRTTSHIPKTDQEFLFQLFQPRPIKTASR